MRNLVPNESVQSNQNNQKGCRSDILLAFIGILLLRRASHIPQSALVSGEGGVVPHVEEDAMKKTTSQSALTSKGGRKKNTPLGLVLVGLVFDLLYLHFHAVPGESNIFALHLFARVFAYILHDAVDDESDRGKNANKDEEQDEGKETAGAHGGVRLSEYRRVVSSESRFSTLGKTRRRSED